jgi:S-adenosylmethionine:tRNA ribosyltransferase-isomerase
MRSDELDYDLPQTLIAQHPAKQRSTSRLLIMDRTTGELKDGQFGDIIDYISPGDCLVLNNTRVLSARFFAHRHSGAQIEGLFLNEPTPNQWLVMLKNARKLKIDESIILHDTNGTNFCTAKALQKLPEGKWLLQIDSDLDTYGVLDQIGFAPLPPYIKRSDDKTQAAADLQRYQTVYAKQPGAVAAPTAGLHFTDQLLKKITLKKVNLAYITLHVGAGTFKPVTSENIEDHEMHSERFSITEDNARIINDTIDNGKRIIAVGTTSVRTLETVAQDRRVAPCTSSTTLFIRPGYEFKIVDAMITNFHLPRSTLIALVGAFAGLDRVMTAYQHAVKQQYRFYSYGDAMLMI